jgi:hypothetical protein
MLLNFFDELRAENFVNRKIMKSLIARFGADAVA